MSRTMHAIQYDELHDEIVVPQPFGHAVLTFRGGAAGEEAPIRTIIGPKTKLAGASSVAIDPVNNEILIPGAGGTVLVFPREANGDVAPIRILQPDAFSGRNAGPVAVDSQRNLMVVATSRGGDDSSGQGNVHLMIFNRTDQGKVKPLRIIGGAKSGLNSLSRIMVYPPRGEIIAVVPGPSSGVEMVTETAFVGVWSIDDNGDVPPRWTIGGPHGALKKPRGVALDPKNKTVIVSDKYLNAVLTFSFPEIF